MLPPFFRLFQEQKRGFVVQFCSAVLPSFSCKMWNISTYVSVERHGRFLFVYVCACIPERWWIHAYFYSVHIWVVIKHVYMDNANSFSLIYVHKTKPHCMCISTTDRFSYLSGYFPHRLWEETCVISESSSLFRSFSKTDNITETIRHNKHINAK